MSVLIPKRLRIAVSCEKSSLRWQGLSLRLHSCKTSMLPFSPRTEKCWKNWWSAVVVQVHYEKSFLSCSRTFASYNSIKFSFFISVKNVTFTILEKHFQWRFYDLIHWMRKGRSESQVYFDGCDQELKQFSSWQLPRRGSSVGRASCKRFRVGATEMGFNTSCSIRWWE